VNENNTATKESLLARTMRRPINTANAAMNTRRSGLQTTKASDNCLTSEQLDTVMNKNEQTFFKRAQGGKNRRNYSVDPRNMNMTQVKPKMLETNVVHRNDFYNLSEGFKKVFTNDKDD